MTIIREVRTKFVLNFLIWYLIIFFFIFNSEQEVTIHGLGAAINRAINLALQLEHRGQGTVEVFSAILLDEAEYDLKNYGHQGGCYQPRPITPSKASSGDTGMLSSAEYSPNSRCCLLSCNIILAVLAMYLGSSLALSSS